jgi:hypothetical protein
MRVEQEKGEEENKKELTGKNELAGIHGEEKEQLKSHKHWHLQS